MEPDVLKDAREVIKNGSLNTVQLARKKYSQLLEPLCRQWSLTKTEMDVLLFLENNPDFDRAADIVNLRQIAKSHVSLSVANLEARGFLYRQYDPTDRRTAHLKLTPAAKPVVQEGNRLQKEFFGRVFAGLTEEEFSFWRSILERVCSNIASMEK